MFSFLSPLTAGQATVDAPSGRPRAVRVGSRLHPVTALESVRQETAAYPLETGPRTVFVVRSQQRRFRLVHLLRGGRWTVEEVAPAPARRHRVA